MTVPNVADAEADYGMPEGGFGDYLKSPTDPTTDWTSGKSPGDAGNSGPGANQMIVDVAAMTRTATRCWVRFTLGASPALAITNPHDALWGNDSGVTPVLAHATTGEWTITWPATITDDLGVSRPVNLRRARVTLEGATLAFVQCSVTAPNVVTVYGFNTSFSANDLSSSYTVHVEAG